MEHVQVLSRMFFRAFVVAMLIINSNPKFIWGLPVGIIVGMLSEAKYMTKENNLKK